jgi:uncharacterized repeat protein (TIGR03943 family)
VVRDAFGGVGAAALGLLLALRLADGSYSSLVQRWYEPLLLGTAAVLLALAVAVSLRAIRAGGRWRFAARPGALVVGALAVLPVVVGLVLKPEPLGASRLEDTRDTALTGWQSAAPGSSEPLRRNVYQWAYEFATGAPAQLIGQEVDTVGFVYHASDDPTDGFSLARFVVACCIADARGYTIPVQWPAAATLQDDRWVHVRGRVATDPQGALLVRATAVEPIDPPSNPYIYP